MIFSPMTDNAGQNSRSNRSVCCRLGEVEYQVDTTIYHYADVTFGTSTVQIL